MNTARKILTFGDLGLKVIDVDGHILLTKEYGSGYEQQWVESENGAVAYQGKSYKELNP